MTELLISLLCKDDMQEFATRLREARTARNLTQVRLAELLEVAPRVYSRWECGGALPQFEALIRIAKVLHVSVDSLVGLEDAKDKPLIHNPRLYELWLQLDSLSDEDQQALYVLVDSVLKRSQMAKLLTT
jgi:transcriptional regulator with XRE-family HTH domain